MRCVTVYALVSLHLDNYLFILVQKRVYHPSTRMTEDEGKQGGRYKNSCGWEEEGGEFPFLAKTFDTQKE
jgi:hypothetical protein